MSLKIGIRAHDLPGAPFEKGDDLINALKDVNLDTIQLVFKKCFKNFSQDVSFIIELSEILKNNNINVAMIGAYFNMIHPNGDIVDDGKLYFKWCLECANVFNCRIVGSETGSLNGDKWTYNPLNHSDDSYTKVKDIVIELNKYGHIFKTSPIIEGAYAHTIYEPKLLSRLVNETEINDVTVDIFNYLNIDNYKNANDIFDECLDLFKDKIKIFHIKDYNVVEGRLVQCSIGDGIMDYKYMIPKIKELCPNATLILEGTVGRENIINSVNYLRSIENA